MIPITDPNDRILLRNLLPNKLKPQTNGFVGNEIFQRYTPVLFSCLSDSHGRGVISDDELKEVSKEIDKLTDFFRQLSDREKKLFNEGVKQETDTGLKSELENLFGFFCQYLDVIIEVLFRLRNSGHISDDQYQRLVRSYESHRQIHRKVVSYLDTLYL